jgi:hypothetical protein
VGIRRSGKHCFNTERTVEAQQYIISAHGIIEG